MPEGEGGEARGRLSCSRVISLWWPKDEGPRTGGPGRRHDRPPGVWGRPGKWPKSDEFSKCEQPLRGVNSSQAGCGAVAPQKILRAGALRSQFC